MQVGNLYDLNKFMYCAYHTLLQYVLLNDDKDDNKTASSLVAAINVHCIKK